MYEANADLLSRNQIEISQTKIIMRAKEMKVRITIKENTFRDRTSNEDSLRKVRGQRMW